MYKHVRAQTYQKVVCKVGLALLGQRRHSRISLCQLLLGKLNTCTVHVTSRTSFTTH